MIPQYILELTFYPIIYKDEVYYWRDCIEPYDSPSPGSAGYIMIYPDGEYIHTYNHPEYMIDDWIREDQENLEENITDENL